MNLDFISWRVNPIAFQIGNAEIRWYGLMFPIGFLAGYLLGKRMFKQEGEKLDWVDTLFIIIFISGILGARLVHVFCYDWAFFRNHPEEIFKTWHGGLASHGGVVGVMCALYIWSRYVVHRPFLWILDKVSVCAALLAGLIRLGNLMNSEIYGIQTSLPWGFIFERNGESIPKHPTQLYEALCYFAIFALLYYLYFYRKVYQRQGYLTGLFAVMVFSARFLIEFIKNNQSPFETNMLLNMGQLLSIPFIVYGIYLIIKSRNTE
ncbi:MAG: prolipoprotein diacylglyceryl transferase [Mangrovibacterium sp.]